VSTQPDPRTAQLVLDALPLQDGAGWDWEGARVGGKLHLFYYFRDWAVALTPLEVAPDE
jgi:hypothetical protein